MQIQPYLFFEGRCEEAIDFYKSALGAQLLGMMRFKESPTPAMTPPGAGDKIMHATLRIGEQLVFVSDGNGPDGPKFEGFSLCITSDSTAEVERLFGALNDGGQAVMPLAETFYSPLFGMTKDRFGVLWMVMANKQ
jgi:PhnB protein